MSHFMAKSLWRLFISSSLVFSSVVAHADIKQSVTLDFQNAIANGYYTSLYLASGSGKLTLQSTGNANVRGYLSITAPINNVSAVSLDRAYVKTRFDSYRLTLGKTRLSWGEGAVFNAGDVIMGGSDLSVDLNAEEKRSNSRWLLSLSKNHGRFAFSEFVLLPPETDVNDLIGSSELNRASAAARTQFQVEALAKTKLELGVLLKQGDYRPYLSLQGGQGLNWHLSSALQSNDQIQTSLGLYSVFNAGASATLSYRAELLHQFDGDAEASGGDESSVLGYVDLGLSGGGRVSYFSRSLLSFSDSSALWVLGANMNLHQGLNLFSHVAVQTGGIDDDYSSDAIGAQSLTLGARFVF